MTDEKELNKRNAPAEVWVTHHALDISEPDYQFLVGVNKDPWDAEYNAPITQWASNTRYIRADLVDPAAIPALQARIEELEAYIENAGQAMSETSPNWEARCHAIMTALNMDFGGYSEDLPEVGSWFEVTNSKNLARIEELVKGRDGLLRVVTRNHVALQRAEAKLTKAVEALRETTKMLSQCTFTNGQYFERRKVVDKANATLADLEGETK